MEKIRILSLDGGGSAAGIHARTLGRLYGMDTPGREIIREFDFVAGNSGGSIVFTALCCNYTPHQIDEFYSDPDTLKRMYSPRRVANVPLLRCFLPRYSSEGKFEALKAMFDRKKQLQEPAPSGIHMDAWSGLLGKNTNGRDVVLLVTAFDYDRERAAFFRSNASSPARSSTTAINPTLAEAVHASTNAPILYYDKPASVCGRRYWDGALAGYNNPVLAAVIEALASRPGEADKFRVLSLGVGTCMKPLQSDEPMASSALSKNPGIACLLRDLGKAATAVFGDPPDVATFHAYMALRQAMPPDNVTNDPGQIVRLCPVVRPIFEGEWRLPHGLCLKEFNALFKLGLDTTKRRDVELIRKMCDLWLADCIANQPIRMGRRMCADVGQDAFSAGAAHWKAISA